MCTFSDEINTELPSAWLGLKRNGTERNGTGALKNGAKDIMVRTYGPTFLTDCTPNTSSWDDSGCALGQSIELDTGHEDAPMKMRVHVHPALLESGKLLKVTLSQVVGRGQGLARR